MKEGRRMSNINLDLYKIFYEVAKYKNMTKAAEELYVSQPAISKSIHTLENQIGATLFYRSNKGLELTSEGKILFNRIKPALALIYNAENELQEFQKMNFGELKIGISSVLTKCLLFDVLSTFRIKYPNIKIIIKNGLTSDLINDLNNGKLDFVIYNESNKIEPNVDFEYLTSLKHVFFYNPIFFNYEITKLDDLKSVPLILQNKNSYTRKLLDEYTNNELQPSMEVVSQELICQLTNIGLGVGFGFEKIVDMINNNFNKYSFDEIPNAKINIAKNKEYDLSIIAKTFIQELKQTIL
jgi:DNA-binding transcriptional LysR family regulator